MEQRPKHVATKSNLAYKPFAYPWMYDAWKKQQEVHWLAKEVPFADDVKDWDKLKPEERNLLTQIFRFFTQQDVEVQDCYAAKYARIFQPTECKMMLTAFSNMETIHIDAYATLLETVGMPEVEYLAFTKYAEMKAKSDYLAGFNVDDATEVAKTLAVFGGFTEGLQLFGSFAMLMNFPRFNKMKGMGQIVSWSVRDETLHTNSIIRLFHTWLEEHPEIDRHALSRDLQRICAEMVQHEDAFIDLAFELGDVEGLKAQEVKDYIRYVANIRCRQLGIESPYSTYVKNPLPWLDSLLSGLELANFFEARSTEYSKAATLGEWGDEIYS